MFRRERRSSDSETLFRVDVESNPSMSLNDGESRSRVSILDRCGALPLLVISVVVVVFFTSVLCLPFIMGKLSPNTGVAPTNERTANKTRSPVLNHILQVLDPHFEPDSSTSKIQEIKQEISLTTEKLPSELPDMEVMQDIVEISRPVDFEMETEILGGMIEKSTNQTSIGILIPLRGPHSHIGFRYGKPVKQFLSKMYKSTGDEYEVLVRDSQADPEVAKRMTQHFYDVHNTRKFFGYITDDEALEVTAWARKNAPGARFVSPTATSSFLDNSPIFSSIQPSSKILASAVADILSIVAPEGFLVVSKSSIHTDAFLLTVLAHRLEPYKVIYYYEWSKISEIAKDLESDLNSCIRCPVLLLGDSESWDLILDCDALFPVSWVLPFAIQSPDKMITEHAEILTFQYRPHDYYSHEFLEPDVYLNPLKSVINASLHLLEGRLKNWKGSYVVSLFSKMKEDTLVLSSADGWVNVFGYDVVKNGVVRRLYQDVLLSPVMLDPLLPAVSENCTLIIRFIDELDGSIHVNPLSISSNVLVPVERGANIHVDCLRQHSDIKCRGGVLEGSPVKCNGMLQGHHKFQGNCGTDIELEIVTSKGCVAKHGVECNNESSSTFGCRLSDLCSTVASHRTFHSCERLILNRE